MHRNTLLACALLMPTTLCAHEGGPSDGHRSGRIDCIRGAADEFGCQRIDLLAHWSLDTLGGGHAANDIWGWTDATTGREYVLIGTFGGTVFVDITDPEQPVHLGMLPAHDELRCSDRSLRHDEACETQGSAWRDIKVYADHAYIVSEAFGHGMQVFDLRRLREPGKGAKTLGESHWFGGFGDAHNLAINETTGFAYALGSSHYRGGPYFIDLSVPSRPVAAGGYDGDGYTHDAQCVLYSGPDSDYTGAEICLLSNEDTVTIVDVSDKAAPVPVARVGYERASYTHQGWLDETQRWFYVNDELDEQRHGGRTTSYVWDLADLDAPVLVTVHPGTTGSIDHNHYVRGRYLYQSNYTSGLRVLDIGTPHSPVEVAWFDTFPSDDHPSYDGSWSNFPFFASGTIAVSDMEGGLFLLRHRIPEPGTGADLRLELGQLTQPEALKMRYTVTVHNDGDNTLSDVVVTHVLDHGISSHDVTGIRDCRQRALAVDCPVGAVAPGDSVSMTMTQTATGSGSKWAEVTATALNADPELHNNKAGRSIVVEPASNPPPAIAPGGGGLFLWPSLVLLFARKLRHRRTASQ